MGRENIDHSPEDCDAYCAYDEMIYTGKMPEELKARFQESGRMVISLEEAQELHQMGVEHGTETI